MDKNGRDKRIRRKNSNENNNLIGRGSASFTQPPSENVGNKKR